MVCVTLNLIDKFLNMKIFFGDMSMYELKVQLQKSIHIMETKLQSTPEVMIEEYLSKYNRTLKLIESGASKNDVLILSRGLLNCARGYMETSSHYQQEFLNEMIKTEKIITKLNMDT
jgi:hypothetical protein